MKDKLPVLQNDMRVALKTDKKKKKKKPAVRNFLWFFEKSIRISELMGVNIIFVPRAWYKALLGSHFV